VACSGLALGFVGLQTPGLVLLAVLVPVVAVGAVRELRVIHSDLLLALASIAVATGLYESIMLAGVMATGGVFDPVTAYRETVLPAAIVNLALMPPVFAVMRLAKPAVRHRLSYS
jgi:hypothetical protein